MNKIEQEWNSTHECMQSIRADGGFSVFALKNQNEVGNMTLHERDCVCCMDGRVAPFKNAVAIAGSGLLVKDDPVARDLLVEKLLSQGVQKVFLHEDCGAVGLYSLEKGISREHAEKDASAWAEELSGLLKGNTHPETLSVTLDFHNEQCVYLTFLDRFSLQDIQAFPTGFQVSGSVVSFDDALAQVGVAIDIALGDHGFGDRFTQKDPFTVVIVAKNKEELQKIQSNQNLIQLIKKYNGRVMIDGFVV